MCLPLRVNDVVALTAVAGVVAACVCVRERERGRSCDAARTMVMLKTNWHLTGQSGDSSVFIFPCRHFGSSTSVCHGCGWGRWLRWVRVVVQARVLHGSGEENGLAVVRMGPGEGYGMGRGELARTVFISRGERGACVGAGAGAVWERGGEWAGRGSDGEVVGKC